MPNIGAKKTIYVTYIAFLNAILFFCVFICCWNRILYFHNKNIVSFVTGLFLFSFNITFIVKIW
jgi:hypothetical protein